ncbi:Protein SMG8 [Glycine max]|nr:Protein SMG8 [Glycine max]KAH1222235.1 Protein SMG8 [Glycine max]
MEPRNPSPSPSPVRVLIRPPSSSSSSPSSSSDHPSPAPAPSLPRSSDGVVVVGFIARRHDDSAQLLNRVIDSNVFASGNLDTPLLVDDEEAREWFERRRISYFHDHDKGILFLQFSSTRCPVNHAAAAPSGFDSAVEEHEFGDLQGMLFMFDGVIDELEMQVCHVIIYIQEGSHFGTGILRNFRVLQAAKHAMAPFVRYQTMGPLPSRSHPSPSSQPVSSVNNSSPGRGGGNLGRNMSAISLMSGLGSYASLFPGQCIPVTLFVFIDDFSSLSNSSANGEESLDGSSLNQSSSLSSAAKENLPAKGSGSVVVLARPASRSEGGFRKKLQLSLEAQIRFLVKKCRTLSGSEITHSGVRTGGTSTSAPLFSLDASRTVVLLDRSSNQRGVSLEFASGLIDDVLNGKATSDSLLLESHSQSASKEDLISVKEFVYRQSDILRGRGGLINTSSGSAAGAGMVAVAAAAAAASAASGKTFTTPDLPNLEVWSSSSRHILSGVLCAKGGCLDEFEIIKRKPRPRNTVSSTVEGSSKSTNPFDVAVSWLQSGRGLNTKFSTLWCQRAIPAAKEIYLKDLPACYPTSQHEAHLDKALHAFRSMVKGPAVELFAKKLEEECTSIWKSERQLCDAVSLTGKPCMHQRHDVETSNSDLGAPPMPHSSGYSFLHACACGRSQQLCPDPFDFESSDASCFSDCDKLLPAVKLTEIEVAGPVQSSAWSLLRIGGSKYYESSKGLLQSGFCATEKFLLKWTIYLEKKKIPNGSTEGIVKQGSVIRAPKVEYIADAKKTDVRQAHHASQNGVEDQGTSLDILKADDKKISFGSGFPIFKMRKPFSEVVAGSAAGDSGFPPLQQRKLLAPGSEKGMKQSRSSSQTVEQVSAVIDHEISQKSQHVSSTQGPLDVNANNICRDGDPFLRIGSNVVPLFLNGGEMNISHSLKHAIVYVGFEHECPCGHRFLLNAEHLTEVGSAYSLSEESHISSMEPAGRNQAFHTKVSKNASWNQVHRSSNEILSAISNKERDVNKSNQMIPNSDMNSDGLIRTSIPLKQPNWTSIYSNAKPLNLIKDFGGDLQAISMDGDDLAFSMLNQNLPIYMMCPHCKHSRNNKDTPKVKFASGISQLKRIFLVTPAFPVILATCPVVQFETSCLPPSVPDREQKLQFSLGCEVILPPESFLTLKLPFVYGVQLEDGNKHPLNPFEQQPEMTAWITKGTVLQILSKGNNDEGYQTQ